MKVPLGWLAEWIPLPGEDELQERLTVGGLEIEDVIRTGPDLAGIRVGLVAEREAHPDADRLSVCRVDLGDGEPVDIVCGAPNVAAGQKVAVATHGTVLPGGLKIKRSKIRGVKSNGMICSQVELGLGEDAAGILVLADDAPVGALLTEILPAGETVLDFEITPNRGDWVSMLGMAREVRAHFGGELTLPPCDVAEGDRDVADEIEITVEDGQGCHRYVARTVHGVTVGPSPTWLQERLEHAGLRSVNNVVDVTNLVLLEFGQPLHAFDLGRVRGGRISARAAGEGEKLLTLDGEDRELRSEDLVIADAEGAVAIAGVMGGSESEVSEATTDVLIESAHFHPARVRRTARRLGLHSDASYRFERGVDPEGQERAADRAARLIQELAGGVIARGRVVAIGEPAPRVDEIALSPSRVNRLLGSDLEADTIVALLARVDIEARADGEDLLQCLPPRYRSDVHLEADLVEEVARIHGYDRITPTLPIGRLEGVSIAARRRTREAVRSALAEAGLAESMTFPGCSPSDDDRLGLAADDSRREHVALVNPIQAGDSVLRTHLLPSVLRSVKTNRSRQVERVRLFEVGRVFVGGVDRPDAWQEREPIQAVAVICEASRDSLWVRDAAPLFFHAKGVAERLLDDLGWASEFRVGSDEPFLHPGASGEFRVQGAVVIRVGDLHPQVSEAFGIEDPCSVVIVDVDGLDRRNASTPTYREVSRHPRVRRDLALLVDAAQPSGDLLAAIRKKAGASLLQADLFDRYEGKGVPEGKVSLAVRLVFQRIDRTLTDQEVTESVDKVIQVVKDRFGAELR